jgi:peptide/nickel transport system substrate-binding protein
MKTHSLLAAAAALTLGAAAGAATAPSTIRISVTSDIRSSQPGVNRDSNSDAVMMQVVEGLVAYGEDATVRPLLARSVDISPDGKTYTFKLREGVKFQNGEPFSSADVLWTWQHDMDPKTGWRCRTAFDGRDGMKVTGVDAPDPHTVVFHLSQPNGLFLTSLARVDCGGTGILQKASVKPDGTWDKPIGTGPFAFAEWKRGQYVRLTRYAGYANPPGKPDGYTGSKRPLVDEVRFMVVPDASTAKAALQRGDIDIIQDLPDSDATVLEKVPGIKVAHAPVLSMSGLLMQTRDPLLSNVKLRQAIAHAIDGKQLVEAVSYGLAQPNNSIVPKASSYYGPVEQKGWAYDPALSRKLLQQAGYKGQALTLLATKRFPQTYQSAVLMQAMLQAAGINTRLEVMEWAAMLDRYNTGKYQLMSFPYSARMDPALSFDSITGNKDKQPRKVWDNPQAIKLIKEADLDVDHAQRQKIFDQLHQMFIADAPMVPLYNPVDIVAYRSDIKGYRPWAVKSARLWEVEKTAK